VLEERVLLRVEAILEVLIERANVRGVAVVDAIDHTEEVLQVASERNLPNVDRGHGVT
jgi:hypothetical protein